MKLLWLSILLAAACGANASAPPGPSRATQARIERIERGLLPPVRVRGEDVRFSLEERMREYKIPALSIAVFERYELQWAKAYGLADVEAGTRATEDTIFLAGSISKSVNALAAMLVVADGQLALDAPINDALETWKLPENELTRAAPVTLRRLLSHTAGTTVHGFPGYAAGAPIPTVPQILDGAAPANTAAVRVDLAPGTRFRYSGGGTTIVQLALGDRTKRPYPELLRERVLAPLGMASSTFEQALPPDRLAHAAAGHGRNGEVIEGKRHAYPEMGAAGLWTTPSDLARFFAELARARAGASSRVTKAIATEMTKGEIEAGPGTQIGLGVFLHERNGARLFGHGGADAGFQATALASLDGGFGVIVMTNSDNGFQIFSELERAVFAEYGWPGDAPEVVRVAIAPEQRARVTGAFMWQGAPLTIAARGDRLEARRPFGKPSELIPVGPDAFVSRNTATRFQLDPTGATLTGSSPGVTAVAPRIPASTKLPILELEAGRFDDAVAAWRALAASDPQHPSIDEQVLNRLGYDLYLEDPASAILVLRLVEAANPDSSNASDSLAEAYMWSGDKPRAIAAYEAALRKLDADPRIPAGRKPAIRVHTEQQLAKLRAPTARGPAPAPAHRDARVVHPRAQRAAAIPRAAGAHRPSPSLRVDRRSPRGSTARAA